MKSTTAYGIGIASMIMWLLGVLMPIFGKPNKWWHIIWMGIALICLGLGYRKAIKEKDPNANAK